MPPRAPSCSPRPPAWAPWPWSWTWTRPPDQPPAGCWPPPRSASRRRPLGSECCFSRWWGDTPSCGAARATCSWSCPGPVSLPRLDARLGPSGRLDPAAWPDLPAAVARIALGIGAAAAGIIGLPPRRFALAGGLLLIAAAGAWKLRGGRVSSLGVAASLCLLLEYGLEALLRAEFSADRAARSTYVYLGALLIWLVIGDAVGASPIRFRTALARSAIGVALACAIVGNMMQFVGAARAMKVLRGTLVSQLRLVEAARGDARAPRSMVWSCLGTTSSRAGISPQSIDSARPACPAASPLGPCRGSSIGGRSTARR